MKTGKITSKRIALACVLLLFLALVFIVDRYNSTYGSLYYTDVALLDSIQSVFSGKAADAFFPIVTVLGNTGIFWILLGTVFIIIPKTRKIGITVLAAIALGYLFGNLLVKNYVGRLRPYQMNEAINLIIKAPSETSFPSGHTLCSFSSATVIFLNRKKLGIGMLALASVIAFSRMYLYVHYPTDILGGILLGILMANLAVFIVDKIYDRRRNTNPSSKAEPAEAD